MHSHHIFILPFKWDPFGQKQRFAAQTSLKKLHALLGDAPALPETKLLQWKRKQFNWDTHYNEAIYFHPFVRDVLFDTGDDKQNGVLQYEISGEGQQLEYHIFVNKSGQEREFILKIEKITLSFYEMGIGMLAFSLDNEDYSLPDDILLINDYGRRIFPQFLGYEKDIIERLNATKDQFLADKIEIRKGNDLIAGDDFVAFAKGLSERPNKLEADFLLPRYIRNLLPATLSDPELYACTPVLDDRMHVVCWVASKEWDILRRTDQVGRSADYWYSLIFADGTLTSGISSDAKMLEYTQKHTYTRWTGEGIYYGICRCTFIIHGEHNNWFHQNIVILHLKTMYLKMVQLSLLQRACIVRFSEQITAFSRDVSNGYRVNKHSEEVRALYSHYLHFINKVYFREVTPQEQGIELYKMIQENMEIERDVKALQGEINEFSRVLDLESDDRQSDALNTLTVVGIGLAVPSLILAYYGTFTDKMKEIPGYSSGVVPINTLYGLLAGVLAGLIWVKSRTWDMTLKVIIRIAAVALVFWVMYSAIK